MLFRGRGAHAEHLVVMSIRKRGFAACLPSLCIACAVRVVESRRSPLPLPWTSEDLALSTALGVDDRGSVWKCVANARVCAL